MKLNFVVKGIKIKLNEKLVKEQNLTPEGISQLKKIYGLEIDIKRAMSKTDDPEELKKLANQMTSVEFKKQKIWGFPLNENQHRWFDVPKCVCAKADNKDRLGTIYRSIMADCPVHGTQEVVNEKTS